MAVTAPCPLCGGAARHVLSAPDRRLGGEELYEVWVCKDCGLGRTRPPLSPAGRAAAYPPDYAPYQPALERTHPLRAPLAALAQAGFGYGATRLRPLARALAALRGWTWQPPPPPPGRLLDVGCGSGAYGAGLLRLGWQVDGIEPDTRAAARARAAGLCVQAGDALTCELPPATYDAITLWHVLEHLDDPIAALRHLRPALKREGLLIVEAPNFAGLGARLTGSHWFHLDLPRHRLHFTPASLDRAVTMAGFSATSLSHIPNPHGLAGAIAYRWGRRWRWHPAVQMSGWAFGLLAAALRRGEAIRITAVAGER